MKTYIVYKDQTEFKALNISNFGDLTRDCWRRIYNLYPFLESDNHFSIDAKNEKEAVARMVETGF